MIQTLAVYKEKRFPIVEEDFLRGSLADWDARFTEISRFLRERLREAVAGAARVQDEERVACANISISLPLTSIHTGKPMLLVDFYDEAWFYGRPFYRYRIPADLFFSRWRTFTCQAEDEAYYQRRTLRKTMIRTLYAATLERLVFLLACRMKSWLADIDREELLKGLVIKVPFYLSLGMYYDAQKPIYAVLPTVDLVATEEKDLSLHHFDRKIYRQHVLERKDLQLSRFTACLFEPATLRELDLRDAVFQDCRFHHVDFSSVKLAGSIWRNCTFADCTFTQVTASSADEDEIYAQPLWENCLFQGVHMQQCDWRGCVLMDCVNDGVKFSDCQLADSGWLSFGR